MDYSLLLCVEYNSDYIEKHENEFKKHEIYNCFIEKNLNRKIEEDQLSFKVTKKNELDLAREFVNKMLDTSIYDSDIKSKSNKGKWATIFR